MTVNQIILKEGSDGTFKDNSLQYSRDFMGVKATVLYFFDAETGKLRAAGYRIEICILFLLQELFECRYGKPMDVDGKLMDAHSKDPFRSYWRMNEQTIIQLYSNDFTDTIIKYNNYTKKDIPW